VQESDCFRNLAENANGTQNSDKLLCLGHKPKPPAPSSPNAARPLLAPRTHRVLFVLQGAPATSSATARGKAFLLAIRATQSNEHTIPQGKTREETATIPLLPTKPDWTLYKQELRTGHQGQLFCSKNIQAKCRLTESLNRIKSKTEQIQESRKFTFSK